MDAVEYEPNIMKLAVLCIHVALALSWSKFLLVKPEAADVWNWAGLILAVGSLIHHVVLRFNCKVCVACYIVGPLENTRVSSRIEIPLSSYADPSHMF